MLHPAEFKGENLVISVKVEEAPPGITHWQHFHGFKSEQAASCPPQTADANGDGIVDLIETEPAAGTTMVPFNEAPASMDVAHGTYPKASAKSAYGYHDRIIQVSPHGSSSIPDGRLVRHPPQFVQSMRVFADGALPGKTKQNGKSSRDRAQSSKHDPNNGRHLVRAAHRHRGNFAIAASAARGGKFSPDVVADAPSRFATPHNVTRAATAHRSRQCIDIWFSWSRCSSRAPPRRNR